jgi:membrane fusion protein (multidrug efflux system)
MRSSVLKIPAAGIVPFVLLLSLSCSRGEGVQNGEDESVPVQLAAVVDTSISSYIAAAANLEPEKTADVLAKVDGTVVSIDVEEGDNVTKGQVLARLDGSELRLQREQARIRAETSASELERAKSLFAKGLMSEKDYSDQKSTADLAQSELEAADLQYSYTTIAAPFTGKVTRRSVDLGRTVRTGTSLFTVEDTTPLLCKIYLPSHLIPSIEVGQMAEVSVGGSADSVITGRVRMISPVVDPATGTVKVTLELNGHDSTVRPGAFADIRMIADTHDGVPAIPRKAVISEGGDLFVFAAGSDTVRRVQVTTGYQQGDLVEVLSGLAPGDSVVVVGHGGIEEGSKIRVVSAPGSTLAEPDTSAAEPDTSAAEGPPEADDVAQAMTQADSASGTAARESQGDGK